MDTLKKIFPLAFVKKNDVAALVINVLLHIVVPVILGVVIGILPHIPVISSIIYAASGLIDLYFTISVVLSFLDYFKVLKWLNI